MSALDGGPGQELDLFGLMFDKETLPWKLCSVSPVSHLRERYCCGRYSVVAMRILKGNMY